MMHFELVAHSESTGTIIYCTEGAYFSIAPPYVPATVSEINDPTPDLKTNLDYRLIGTRDIIRSYEELREWAADEAAPTKHHQSRLLPLHDPSLHQHQPQPQRQRQSRPDKTPTLF